MMLAGVVLRGPAASARSAGVSGATGSREMVFANVAAEIPCWSAIEMITAASPKIAASSPPDLAATAVAPRRAAPHDASAV